MSTDRPPRGVEPTTAGDIALPTIVELLADNVEVKSNPTGVAPTAGRVTKDAENGDIYVGDGDAFLDVQHEVGISPAGLPNLQLVRSADDLPDESGGVRSLEGGRAYLFTDFVSDPATLELGDPATPLLGWHGSHGGYIHTGGNVAVQGVDKDFMMRDMYLHAPGGQVFDLQGDQDTEMLVESHSSSDAAGIANAASLGVIDGFRVPTFKGCNFEDYDAGFEFDGTPDKIFFSECPFREVTAAGVTTITLRDTLDVDIIDLPGNYGKNWQTDTEFVRTEAGGEPSDVLQVRGTTFDGSVNKDNVLVGALDETSVGVNVEGCWPLADSSPGISYSKDGTTTTTITAQDPGDGSEAVKITGPTTEFSSVTDRFTHTSPNRATYKGRRRFKETVHATVSVSGSNTTVAIYFAKNGNILNRSAVDITTASAGQPRAVTVVSKVDLVTDDYLEVWLANEGGTGDIEVSTLEVSI